jgi:aspartyl-tRNA(Asn)/glutamyl-tRNA(Gln) amidotransferase subunit C
MPHPLFDRTEILHLASLASVSLSDAEAETMARELRAIVAYVEELGAVDTSEVDVGAGVAAPTPWRADIVTLGLSHDEALAGAPKATETGFAVPGFVLGVGVPT